MAKRLSDEERLLRKYQNDNELLYVIDCLSCGKRHEISIYGVIDLFCSKCHKAIFSNKKPNLRLCKVIYEKEI